MASSQPIGTENQQTYTRYSPPSPTSPRLPHEADQKVQLSDEKISSVVQEQLISNENPPIYYLSKKRQKPTLDFKSIAHLSPNEIETQIIENTRYYGKAILCLKLGTCPLSKKSQNAIKAFCPNITKLQFGHSSITDDVLRDFSIQYQPLTSLNVSNCVQLSNQIRGTINYLPQLRSLRLRNCQHIEEKTLITALKYLSNLTTIDVSGCKITDGFVSSLMSCQQISKVYFDQCTQITPEALEKLGSKCLWINTLSLKGCPQLNESVAYYFQNLRHFEIDKTSEQSPAIKVKDAEPPASKKVAPSTDVKRTPPSNQRDRHKHSQRPMSSTSQSTNEPIPGNLAIPCLEPSFLPNDAIFRENFHWASLEGLSRLVSARTPLNSSVITSYSRPETVIRTLMYKPSQATGYPTLENNTQNGDLMAGPPVLSCNLTPSPNLSVNFAPMPMSASPHPSYLPIPAHASDSHPSTSYNKPEHPLPSNKYQWTIETGKAKDKETILLHPPIPCDKPVAPLKSKKFRWTIETGMAKTIEVRDKETTLQKSNKRKSETTEFPPAKVARQINRELNGEDND